MSHNLTNEFKWYFYDTNICVFEQEYNGLISWQVNQQTKKSIPFSAKKCESKMLPRNGDVVTFDLYQVCTGI